jgi:hypothetical protein
MSYYTSAHLQYPEHPEGGAIDPSEFKEDLLKMLDEHGLHYHVGDGLIDLFKQGEADFTFYGGCQTLETLLLWVSNQRPNIAFGVQGRGEALRDVWVREISGGQVMYAQGTFFEE